MLESPCGWGIEPPGSINHGVSYLAKPVLSFCWLCGSTWSSSPSVPSAQQYYRNKRGNSMIGNGLQAKQMEVFHQVIALNISTSREIEF